MADTDEVFDALRNCITEPKFFPWEDQEKVGRKCVKVPIALLLDTLNVLKEQPEQKHGHWIEYPKCLEYDGALDDTYIVCSACEHVFNVIDNCTELFDYCPKCGAKMNEENEKEK